MNKYYLLKNYKPINTYKGINTAANGFNRLICRYPDSVIRLYDTELKEVIKEYYPVELLKQIKPIELCKK